MTLSTIGYNLVAAHRPDRTGGVGIIHRDTLKVRKVDAGRSQTGWDSLVGRSVDCHATGSGFNTHSSWLVVNSTVHPSVGR